MSRGISIKTKLPQHKQLVYCLTKEKGQAVLVFFSNEQIFQELIMKGIQVSYEKRKGYIFASQEVPGNYTQDITHWMSIFNLPKE